MSRNNAKNLMRGALLLSVASLISKVLSAVYRIPFQNIVGNSGFYVYQQVYPLYGIGMTLALSGLPNFVSKLIAEQRGSALKLKLLQKIFVLVSGVSVLLFVFLFFNAQGLAKLMGDIQLVSLIQVVAFLFLLTPFLTCLRGYFQGAFDMRPTAISQVVEQVLRVVVILVAAILYSKLHWNNYTMGTVAMSGSLIGGMAAILVMVPEFKRHIRPLNDLQRADDLPSYKVLFRRLFEEGGSLSLFAATMVILQLVDSFSVAKGLIASGFKPEAAYNLKGIYDRAQPLIQLGLVVTMAFVTALLPALTNARQQRKKYLFIKTTQQMVHIALALSTAATMGLIVLMPWINRLLFGDSEGSDTIALYLFSVLFMALINVFSSVLQSLDRFKIPTLALLVGFGVKLLLNQRATQIFGIAGSSLITVLALAVSALIIFWYTPTYVKHAIFTRGFIFKLTVIIIVMISIVAMSALTVETMVPNSRLGAGIVTLVGVLVGVALFLGLSIRMKLLTLREWLTLPLVSPVLHHFLKKNRS